MARELDSRKRIKNLYRELLGVSIEPLDNQIENFNLVQTIEKPGQPPQSQLLVQNVKRR